MIFITTINLDTVYIVSRFIVKMNFEKEKLTKKLNEFSFLDSYEIFKKFPSNIEIINPDGTISSLTSYSNLWLADGTYTIKNIEYQGSSFSPISSRNFIPSAGKSWIVPLSLHDLTFNVKDQIGFFTQ